MSRKLPISGLTRLNLFFALISSLLVAIFLQGVGANAFLFLRFLQTFLFVCITGFANLILFSFLDTNFGKRNFSSRITFFFSSYIIAILAWLFIRTLFTFWTGMEWEGEGEHRNVAYLLAILASWSLNTLILLVQNLLILQHKKAISEIENLQLRANITDANNLLLRQQIHPHFLFNALTTLKSLYKQDLRQGEEYLVHLANFLRVSVSNHKTQTTSIADELQFCNDYLMMQKIRFGNALHYDIQIDPETSRTKFLPYFSLQPLLENALKHNELTEERPITISIREAKGYIFVINNQQAARHTAHSSGNGLANLSERYRLLGREDIKITTDGGNFVVRLKILNK